MKPHHWRQLRAALGDYEQAAKRYRASLDHFVAVAKEPTADVPAVKAAERASMLASSDREVAAVCLGHAVRELVDAHDVDELVTGLDTDDDQRRGNTQ